MCSRAAVVIWDKIAAYPPVENKDHTVRLMQFHTYCMRLVYCLSVVPVPALALPTSDHPLVSQDKAARIYRSPEERREAGLGRQVTDWLKVSSLAEIEAVSARSEFAGGKAMTQNERPVLTLQLGVLMDISEWLEAELIFDFESDAKQEKSEVDEAMLGFERGAWGVTAGRLYVPFGEYYSHFVTGPMLEFGETRADSLIVDYAVNDQLELIGYILESDRKRSNSAGLNAHWDWGASIELVVADDAIRIGAGYLSDLAESDQELLADTGNRYRRRVPAWSLYLLFGFAGYETTLEFVRANGAFRELERNVDQPFAWNIELAFFPSHAVQYALRVEHSEELAEQPRWRYGVSATWRPFDRISLSLEYLREQYKPDFVQNDDGNSLKNRDQVAAQVSLEF